MCTCFGFDNIVCMIFFVNLFSLLLLYFGYCQLFVCIFSSPNTNCDQPYTFPIITFIQPQSQFKVKSIPCSLPTMIPIKKVKEPLLHSHTLCQFNCILQDNKYGQKASYLPYYYYQRIGSFVGPYYPSSQTVSSMYLSNFAVHNNWWYDIDAMKSKTGILSEMDVAPRYKLLKMPSLQTMLWSKE